MPTGRGVPAACAVDGIIYVIGGALDNQGHLTAVVEAYNPKTDRWATDKRPMPRACFFHAATAVNGLIYVVDGTDLFVYDPKADTWVTKRNRFSPYSWGLRSAAVDGIIYIFGGFTQDWLSANNFALAYDPVLDRCVARQSMPRRRAAMACGAIGGKVYIAGGVSKEPVVNPDPVFYTELDVFDPQGNPTGGEVVYWDLGELPADGPYSGMPIDLTNVIAAAVGSYEIVAVTGNGRIIQWPFLDRPDRVDAPEWTNVIAVAAGDHNLALIGNGPPVLHASMDKAMLTAGGFQVSVPTQSGRVFALEYKSSLSDSAWTRLPLVAGNGRERTLTDPNTSGAQRFYRVRRW
jgi:hypothetical protein